jgi:hypothetical protein
VRTLRIRFLCFLLFKRGFRDISETQHRSVHGQIDPFNQGTNQLISGFATCVSWNILLELKLKLSHYTPWRSLGEKSYSSYSFLTSALDGGEWSVSRLSCSLLLGKGPRVTIGQEAGWASKLVWTQRLEEKSSYSAGDQTSIARSSSP